MWGRWMWIILSQQLSLDTMHHSLSLILLQFKFFCWQTEWALAFWSFCYGWLVPNHPQTSVIYIIAKADQLITITTQAGNNLIIQWFLKSQPGRFEQLVSYSAALFSSPPRPPTSVVIKYLSSGLTACSFANKLASQLFFWSTLPPYSQCSKLSLKKSPFFSPFPAFCIELQLGIISTANNGGHGCM